ncbi:hypothetical protein KW787_04200 [Candidatus Pacearchaeota archaeon]|nr:hypothetical protein [Candidatus Pacearchaeota archaeon]
MKTLIIKLGALGDVVRTTVLLQELSGDIFWLTKENAKDILSSKMINRLFFIERKKDLEDLKNIDFDLILSLDEEREVLEILNSLNKKNIIGVFLNGQNNIEYTKESSYWYDMSLISKLGKKKADEIKEQNKKSVPQILIEMIGKRFSGQEYSLDVKPRDGKGTIGLIDISTSLWPNKAWSHYKDLAKLLESDGYSVVFLGMRNNLREHIEDINKCELIVCGDTLGMHIALALKKKVVAIFNCTSPEEIYDYGRMAKVISPLYKKYFYKKELSKEAVEAVKVNEVYTAVKKLLNKQTILNP